MEKEPSKRCTDNHPEFKAMLPLTLDLYYLILFSKKEKLQQKLRFGYLEG